MTSTAFLNITHQTYEITTMSNPNRPQLQILDSSTLQMIDKQMQKQPFVEHTNHHITAHVMIISLDLRKMRRRSPSCPPMIPQAFPSASREPSQAPQTRENTSKYKQSIKPYAKNNEISCVCAHLHPKTMVRVPKSTVPAQRSRVQCRVGGFLKGLQ